MDSNGSRFMVMVGNRGFFPSSLIHAARQELKESIEAQGHEALMTDEGETRHGAVETREEAARIAEFFRAHKARVDGVILSLPNFGDETGAAEALREVDVPIFIQAYPDELDKLSPKERRDAFCGKLSIMDVFKQCGIKFTNLIPHTVHPKSKEFADNLAHFAAVCRVTKTLKRMTVGAIGARTTPFKTVRVDEITLEKHGITVESTDLADVFARIDALDGSDETVRKQRDHLAGLADWKNAPAESLDNLARLGVVMDQLVQEMHLDAMALRCWTELQSRYRISPCLVTGNLMDVGIPAACEVDIANAIVMKALGAASGTATSILDWNNNYGAEENKCILFHCGNVPSSLMAEKGTISDHHILSNALGEGKGFGCNQGRIKPMDFTYSSMITVDGQMQFYLGRGRITEDEIPQGFFGCAGVAEIPNLQEVLLWLGRSGHRHHVSITPGDWVDPMKEAFETYLGYHVTVL